MKTRAARLAVCVSCMGAACAGPSPRPGAAPAAAAAAPDDNPFAGARFYANPDYASEVERVASGFPSVAACLPVLEREPTAIWLSSVESAGHLSRFLDDAAAQQAASPGSPQGLVVLVLYDLPNRDCAAASSEGELGVEHGGEARYRTEFVDRIAAQLGQHPSVRVAAIVEPDSLANLATNLDHPKCAAAADVYRRSIAYAIETLSTPNVSLYLDAAHAGWLGWDRNRAAIVRVFADVFALAGGERRVRGFATNVSNYNSLDGREGARIEPSDPCPDELSYVHALAASLGAAGIHASHFVIDTSRNGQGGSRARWGVWCNALGAGLGERPRGSPAPGVDAYYWVKPPGESDGTSDPAAPRYDAACGSRESAPDAPQAGAMFPAYLAQLASRAQPSLCPGGVRQ
jgi:cellulose 1,4-beta-cellobiosidase